MRKQCKRRIYKLVNPIEFAIQGAAYTPEDHLNKLRLLELASIDAFAHGKATVADWHSLCGMLNLCETMARMGIGPEAIPVCKAAQEALKDAQERFERLGRMGTTGPGLQALRELYQFHDLQRSSVSRSEYEKAIKATGDRIRSKAPEVVELA